MSKPPVEVCYLCGQPILTDKTDDHVLQKLFVKRKQPKERGFKYGHVLPTHRTCNARFGNKGQGAESECRDALQRVHDLHSEIIAGQRKDAWLDPRDASGKISGPFVSYLNIALTVLAKSAAAFLVRWHGIPSDSSWRIIVLSMLYGARVEEVFDGLLEHTNALEVGMKYYAQEIEKGNWYFTFTHNGMSVLFYFEFNSDPENFRKMKAELHPQPALLFESTQLIDLVGYDWFANEV